MKKQKNKNNCRYLFGRVFALLFLLHFPCTAALTPQYYCTSSDEKFFDLLLNLIGSIHRHNYAELKMIDVYDLGLTIDQRLHLSKIKKVRVCDLDQTNPLILSPIVTSPSGRRVRGCFSWKPVAIKQSLERFPYVLYLDAGLSVMGNLNALFEFIKNQGYFFLTSVPSHEPADTIEDRVTSYVISQVIDNQFPSYKTLLLNSSAAEISAGCQGVSRAILKNYVMPMYEYSKDIQLFLDDGSSKLGYGSGRHDQILFSILFYVNGFKKFDQGWINLPSLGGKTNCIYCSYDLNLDQMHLWMSQKGAFHQGGNKSFIEYKR